VTSSAREWHDVGAVAELDRRGRLLARVGGREIGVLRLPDGTLAAVRNRCPHSGAPLCRGTPHQRLTGTPGTYAGSGRTVLRCPWHGWEFDVVTGSCPDEPSMRVAIYAARLEDGRVLVHV
jgi:3-phenylpropionate/trans-cinnamate dioxygenase ferredoxin subunit